MVFVHEKHKGVIERFGAFTRFLEPGLDYALSVGERLIQVSLKQQQIEIMVDTKVERSVVNITVKVQYKVLNTEQGIRGSVYKLSKPIEQLTSYLKDVLRSAVSDHSIEQLFDLRDEITKEVHARLQEEMGTYGYVIVATLLTDIVPTIEIKKSLNLKLLEKYRKEADRIAQLIKQSEKNTISHALTQRDEIIGAAISEQRQEIVDGLKSSISAFSSEVSGVTEKDVLELVLISQYMDMVKDLRTARDSKLISVTGDN